MDTDRTSESEALLLSGANLNEKSAKGRTALLRAVSARQADLVRLLLERGADVNARDNRGWTPLARAIQQGQSDITLLLLAHHPDVHAGDRQGRTPLHWAAQYGSAEIAALLLQRGADPYCADRQGNRPLLQAVRHRRTALVKLLLQAPLPSPFYDYYQREALFAAIEQHHAVLVAVLLKHGVNSNAVRLRWQQGTYGEDTPLMTAARRGLTRIVRLLLEHGADIHFHNRLRQSALSEALCFQHNEVVHLLEQHGSRTELLEAVLCSDPNTIRQSLSTASEVEMPDQHGVTLLMSAAQFGKVEAARMLLDAGADVNATNESGLTALMLAAQAGHIPLLDLLVTRGAELEATWGSQTALTFAALRGQLQAVQWLRNHGASLNEGSTLPAVVSARQTAVLRDLLEQGVDANAHTRMLSGRTALMYAAQRRDRTMTDYLLEHGADAQIRDGLGATAYTFAAQAGSYRTARLLLEHMPDFDLTEALVAAVTGGNLRLVAYLLERGTDVNAPEHAQKPLVTAAWKGIEMFQLLLAHNADRHVRNAQGETPLMLAIRRGNTRVVENLLEGGVDVNAISRAGRTALMEAVLYSREELVTLLLARHADVHVRTVRGETVLTQAIQRKNQPIIDRLVQAGATE